MTRECKVLAVTLTVLVACGGEERSDPVESPNGRVSDFDSDNIPDSLDQCPTQVETLNGFEDQDGCPDQIPVGDSDRDGILDNVDGCPDEPENVNGFQDSDGCPDSRIDERFEGLWRGNLAVVVAGFDPIPYETRLRVEVEDSLFRLFDFCPNGTGTMTTTGQGRQIAWEGAYICPFPNTICPSAALVYERADFTLDISQDFDILVVGATGRLINCGPDLAFAITSNIPR